MFVFVSFAIFQAENFAKVQPFLFPAKFFTTFFRKIIFAMLSSEALPLRNLRRCGYFFKSECKGRNIPVNNKIFPPSTDQQQQHDTTHLTTYHNITLIFFLRYFFNHIQYCSTTFEIVAFFTIFAKNSHPFI